MRFAGDIETTEKYLTDESNAFVAPRDGVQKVCFPETIADIRQILKEANQAGTLVTISGAGTGICGSRVPMQGGIVISMEKMLEAEPQDNIDEIIHTGLVGEIRLFVDQEKNEAHVAPGVPLDILAEALPDRLIYPPDPTERSAFLGSTIATNASGARSFYYCPTRKWIKALKIVLPNSDLINLRRGENFVDDRKTAEIISETGQKYLLTVPSYRMPNVKNAAGLFVEDAMDIIDLFIGSDGILGVVAEATIKLAQKPEMVFADIAFFETEDKALKCADELRGLEHSGVLSLEYFDSNSLAFISNKFPVVKAGYQAALLVEIADDDETVMDLMTEILEKHHVTHDWFAESDKEILKQKEFRHALPDEVNSYLKQHESYKLGTDFIVPVDKFAEMMNNYRDVGKAFARDSQHEGIHHVLFGHMGDCHLHFNFVCRSSDEMARAKTLYTRLARKAIELGGTISGEHGVGKKTISYEGQTIPYLELMYGRSGLDEIANLKRMLDPNLILNIGNMVPAEYLKAENN